MARDIPLGNGSLLVNFDRQYLLRDIYWPHVGQKNHTQGNPCRFGLWVDGKFSWLDATGWQKDIRYLHDSLVSDVRLTHADLGIELHCQDCVDFHIDVLLRRVAVSSTTGGKREVRLFFCYDFSIDGNEIGDSAYYESDRRAVFHYKGKNWFMLAGARQLGDEYEIGIDSWAVGNKHVHGLEGTWKDAEDGQLSLNAVAQGRVDSVIGLVLEVPVEGEAVAWHWLCVGNDFPEVTRINRLVKKKGPELLLQRTHSYWQLWANKEDKGFSGLSATVCAVCRRSLMIMRTQIDNSGAILAANDHDFIHFSSDTYSYMWPRDGALVAATFVEVGYSELSRRFFEFCHRVITEEGYLLHKYNPDGSLASSWHGWYQGGRKRLPVQEDETALVIWALWLHFDRFRDVEFIKPHYRGLVIRAANWLVEYRDRNGMVLPSWDLWEERYGIHAWTVGAVWAGLMAAARFAAIFGETEFESLYRSVAEDLRKRARSLLWSSRQKCYVRSLVPENGRLRTDSTMDASLAGLWLFGMFTPDDPRIVATMEKMQRLLWVHTDVGGLARYEDDRYHRVGTDTDAVPGNPWFISTLWLAQWKIAVAHDEKGLEESELLIEWAGKHAFSSGVLAEQIHPYNGSALSVSPLTWSHAALVSTVLQYMEKSDRLQAAGQTG